MRRLKSDRAGWHVMARGARRLELFRDPEDYSKFLELLRYALKKSGCVLWAYVLMSNHYHLVLQGTSSALTACMRRLNSMYSAYHNKRYNLSGHAFDGPYRAYIQASPMLLLRTIAYVFMNPVAAGQSTLENYPWSGYRSFVGQPGSPLEVHPSGVVNEVGCRVKEFWAKFYRALDRESRRPKKVAAPSITMVSIHSTQFEWLLEHALEHKDGLAGEDPQLVAMYWARQCGISPRAIAGVLKDRTPAAVSDQIYRFTRKLKDNPDLAKQLPLP